MNSKRNQTLCAITAVVFLLAVVTGGCGTAAKRKAAGESAAIASLPEGVLFADDFQGRRLEGWTPVNGRWSIKDGVLRQGRASREDLSEGFYFLVVSDLPTSHYRIEVDVRFPDGPSRQDFAGIAFRYQDPFNFFAYRLCDFEMYQDRIEVYELCKGQRRLNQGSRDLVVNPQQWYRLVVEVEDFNIRTYLDGKPVGNLVNHNLPTGAAGLLTKESKAEFRRFRVLEL